MTKELKKIPEDIIEWFQDRGIDNETLIKNKVSYDNGWIVIPILNKDGKTIFKKFRREPLLDNWDTDKPKYKNELGATASLYGIHNELKSPVFIVEGELDALCLQSYGLSAVSSTSGAGNFNKEWAKHFKDKDVFILYDRDEAGFKGASSVQSIIPHAEIIILPDFDGNDVTDFLKLEKLESLLSLSSYNYYIPYDQEPLTNKKEVKEMVNKYKDALDKMVEKRRSLMKNMEDMTYHKWLNEFLMKRYKQYKSSLERKKKRKSGNYNKTDLEGIKQIPISEFLEFNSQGFAKCIFHNDKNPSLYYNEPGTEYSNTVKCFSCGVMADVIDVVMELEEVDFKEAVNILKNK